MALGGGTFLTQNKILPGAYINFISVAQASATLSDRGIATIPLDMNWGPEGEVVTVELGDFQKDSQKIFGYAYTADELKPSSKITLNDNGIATSVVSRSGVALQTNTPIRPIITLKPYRTFQEVEQPASQFLIRVSERGITFVEADGGMWKLAARKTVRDYLAEKLAPEIEAGLVAIAL